VNSWLVKQNTISFPLGGLRGLIRGFPPLRDKKLPQKLAFIKIVPYLALAFYNYYALSG